MYFHIKTINTGIYDDTDFAKIATDVVNTNKHYARTHACTSVFSDPRTIYLKRSVASATLNRWIAGLSVAGPLTLGHHLLVSRRRSINRDHTTEASRDSHSNVDICWLLQEILPNRPTLQHEDHVSWTMLDQRGFRAEDIAAGATLSYIETIDNLTRRHRYRWRIMNDSS